MSNPRALATCRRSSYLLAVMNLAAERARGWLTAALGFVLVISTQHSTAAQPNGTAALYPSPLLLPYPLGNPGGGPSTWYVCQGYNVGTHTRRHRNSLDLSAARNAPAPGGCNPSTWHASDNRDVTAPGSGDVWLGWQDDFVCINFDGDNGSVAVGHLGTRTTRTHVEAGDWIGTVAPPDELNKMYAHIHLELFSAQKCAGDSVPFDEADGTRLDCASDMPFDPNPLAKNQYSGTALTRCELVEFSPLVVQSWPRGIAAGPDGNLWFTEYNGGKIGKMSPLGELLAEYPAPYPGQPWGITDGIDGRVWFTLQAGFVVAMDASGNSKKSRRTKSSATWIETAPNGSMWFVESGYIGRVNIQGRISEFPAPGAYAFGSDLAIGPDGNIWFTEYPSDKIGQMSPSGKILNEWPVSGHPCGITAGPDHAMWFTECGAGNIGRIDLAGNVSEFGPVGADPIKIKLGPNGNLWFVTSDGATIGQITPAGHITEFPLPTANSAPADIVVGPDKNLWFTEFLADRIGQVIVQP